MGKILTNAGNGSVDFSFITATSSDILSGKISTDNQGNQITGTMTNHESVSQSLNCGGSYTIPAGYHNGSGIITANSLSSQTAGTAIASNILKDQTAWVNGSKLTGTMVNNGAVAPTALADGGSYTIPAGYHNGSGKVTAQSLATMTSSGTITNANQILSGYKAYSDGTLYTGSMTNQGAQTKTFTPSASSQSYTIPAGYHNGSGKVTCNVVSNLSAANIKKGVTVGGVTGTWSGYTGDLILYNAGVNNGLTAVEGTFGSSSISFSAFAANIVKYTNSLDLSPYSKLNIDLTATGCTQSYMKLAFGVKEGDNNMSWVEQLGSVTVAKKLNSKVTMSMDISLYFKSRSNLYIEGLAVSGSRGSGTVGTLTGTISKIWFSV